MLFKFRRKISNKLIAVTLGVLIVVFVALNGFIQYSVKENLRQVVEKELNAELQTAWHILEAVRTSAQKKVNSDLNVAHYLFYKSGTLEATEEIISMQAINQITKEVTEVNLNQWLHNGQQVQNHFEFVDRLRSILGGTATIFQRIDQGFLRVSTNVMKLDGSRAVGTYIPNESPVIQTILKGETFRGRAFVVNDWYLTAYEPITIEDEIVGILYVGVKEKNLKALKNAITSIVVGKTGFLFSIDKEGNYIIHPEKEGQEGSGYPHIQEMLSRKNGSISYDGKGTQVLTIFMEFAPFEWILAIEAYENEFVDEFMANIRTHLLWLLFAAILLFAGVLFMFSRSMTRSIFSVVSRLRELAEGDLTRIVKRKTDDEIGIMTTDLNAVTKNLSAIIGEINEITSTLEGTSTELTGISDDIAKNAKQNAVKSGNVCEAAEEMSSNMTSVASATNQASGNIETVAASSQELTASIGEVVTTVAQAKTRTENVVEVAGRVASNINALSAEAEAIGTVTETISNFSDKIDLLALNATIEAAHAGQAGKGFAVVASEIKELANQTVASTTDIGKKLKGIQNSTGIAVSGIEEVAELVEGINEIVTLVNNSMVQQRTATESITENINQASLGLKETYINVDQTTQFAENVVKEISEVSQTASKVNLTTAKIKKNAQHLHEVSIQLKDKMSRFKIDET